MPPLDNANALLLVIVPPVTVNAVVLKFTNVPTCVNPKALVIPVPSELFVRTVLLLIL